MLVSRDFLGFHMPQEHRHLSCRPRATSGAAFGAGEMLLKCVILYFVWLFLAMGFLFLHPEGKVREWKDIGIIRCYYK